MLALPSTSFGVRLKRLTSQNSNSNLINCQCYRIIINYLWNGCMKNDRRNVHGTKSKQPHDLNWLDLYIDFILIISEWNVTALLHNCWPEWPMTSRGEGRYLIRKCHEPIKCFEHQSTFPQGNVYSGFSHGSFTVDNRGNTTAATKFLKRKQGRCLYWQFINL